MSIQSKIARAIEAADNRYFFEDYGKQAAAVVKALKAEGLAIVARTPDEAMKLAGQDAIRPGKLRPEQLASDIWAAMLSKGERS